MAAPRSNFAAMNVAELRICHPAKRAGPAGAGYATERRRDHRIEAVRPRNHVPALHALGYQVDLRPAA
jgi:hypothetical protein